MSRETDVVVTPGLLGPAKAVEVRTKSRARGWIHLVSAIVAVAAGASLISVSWPLAGLKAGLATFVYTGAVVGMFTVSAIYHLGAWSLRVRVILRRIDHVGILFLVAGTYTPFAVLALHGSAPFAILVWSGLGWRGPRRDIPRGLDQSAAVDLSLPV